MHPKSVSIAPPLGGTRDECGPETELKGHPQERQHSAPSSAKSGTECPRRGVPNPLARGIKARRAETPLRLGLREPDPACPDAHGRITLHRRQLR